MRRHSQLLLFAGWCVLLFAATLGLHTRSNTFPYYYHPDEPGKVEQVMGVRPWNFHHPMLLLAATKGAVVLTGEQDPQAVVESGRWVSAGFTSLAVVAFSLLGFLWRGWVVGVLTGLTLLLHHQLFELSHYLKEDTALLCGIALAFLAAHRYARKPGMMRAIVLGAACGVAISGKYLGAIMLLIAWPLFWRERERWAHLRASLIALVLVVGVMNLPLFLDFGKFRESFGREVNLVVEGQGQMTQRVPHTRYWNIFLTNTTPVMWVLLLVVLWRSGRMRRQLRLVEWLTIGFPFVFAIALSFSPKDNDRYFLPATALFTLLAAVGVEEVAGGLTRKFPPWVVRLGLGAALVLAQLPSWTEDRGGLLRYWKAFQEDDTGDLVNWVRAEVPADAVLAKDDKVRLPSEQRHGLTPEAAPLPQRILSDDYAPDLALPKELLAAGYTAEQVKAVEGLPPLQALRAIGVTHVLITDSTFRKFEREGLKSKAGDASANARRGSFYAELRRMREPVWRRERGTVIYLHPGIEVYTLGEGASDEGVEE